MEQVLASELLRQLGYSTKVTKSGPAQIINALKEIGLTPSSVKPIGKGVSFLVFKSDAEKALKTVKKGTPDNDFPDLVRRDIRTISRALIDLYKRLGEEPHQRSNIYKLAERELND